jgi:hypothetical protein
MCKRQELGVILGINPLSHKISALAQTTHEFTFDLTFRGQFLKRGIRTQLCYLIGLYISDDFRFP